MCISSCVSASIVYLIHWLRSFEVAGGACGSYVPAAGVKFRFCCCWHDCDLTRLIQLLGGLHQNNNHSLLGRRHTIRRL